MPHPLLLLLGVAAMKKAAMLTAVQLYGWPRVYRSLMRTNRAMFADKATQNAVRDGVQRAIRFPSEASKIIEDSNISRVIRAAIRSIF